MKTYLITGGAGFIGSNFIKFLIHKYSNDVRIVNLDKLTYCGNLSNLSFINNLQSTDYTFIKGDICDKCLIDEIFLKFHPDYIVNFAAESHVDRSIKEPEIFIKTNVLGTQVLLEFSLKHGVEKFIQISTDEVYGSLGSEGYFYENTPLDPHSPYSASKAGADMLVKAYHDTYGLPVNITRCSNNYGPFQFPEKLIPLLINNCLYNKKLPVYGDGKNIRDWLFVEDHCSAIDLVVNKAEAGEIFNIGGNNEKENIYIVTAIIKYIHELLPSNDERKKYISEDLITFIKDRRGHDRRYAIDATKIRYKTGWVPKTSFDEGIVKTIKWYLDNSDWLYSITSGAYRNITMKCMLIKGDNQHEGNYSCRG